MYKRLGSPSKVYEYGRILLHPQNIECHKLLIITFSFFDTKYSKDYYNMEIHARKYLPHIDNDVTQS